MPYNGSGVYSLPTNSFAQAVTGTTISSSGWNSTGADLATALTTAICKDGQTTTTARVPFAQGISNGSQTLTAVADGTAVTHAATVGQIQSSASKLIASVAGTNTITGTVSPALTAYASGQQFILVPANTNTGATTVNINSVGAKNIFANGGACVGGELVQSQPVLIEYDGTQFNIIGGRPFINQLTAETAPATDDEFAMFDNSTKTIDKITFENYLKVINSLTEETSPDRAADFMLLYDTGASGVKKVKPVNVGSVITLGTEQASTSGTSIDFTGIPAGTKRIVVMFRGVSTSGTSGMIIQLGDSGGVEPTGYSSVGYDGTTPTAVTSGFALNSGNVAANTYDGTFILTLEDSSDFAWTGFGIVNRSGPGFNAGSGSKALSAELDRVRITTIGGTDTFDAGVINITYE